MKYALVDTGIWIAMFDPNDKYHERSKLISESFDKFHLILPWPTLYETLRTKFVKKTKRNDRI